MPISYFLVRHLVCTLNIACIAPTQKQLCHPTLWGKAKVFPNSLFISKAISKARPSNFIYSQSKYVSAFCQGTLKVPGKSRCLPVGHETQSGSKRVDSNANLTIWQLFEIKTDSPSPWTYFGTRKCCWDEVISEDRVAFSRWSVCVLNAVWCLSTVNDEIGDLCDNTANSIPDQTFSAFFLKRIWNPSVGTEYMKYSNSAEVENTKHFIIWNTSIDWTWNKNFMMQFNKTDFNYRLK